MQGVTNFRNRPVVLAIAIGCLNGLIWAVYYALVKHAGVGELILVFLGGIPPVAFVAWHIIGQVQARNALQKELRATGTPIEEVGGFAVASRIAVGCLAPIASLFAGLLGGIGLLASGVSREWTHPDQIAVLLAIPAATLALGFITMQTRVVGRRAAMVAVGAALASIAVAGALGLVGYFVYPWLVSS